MRHLIAAGIAAGTLLVGAPAFAQHDQGQGYPSGGDQHGQWRGGDEHDAWRGAPAGVSERIDWLQHRIERGIERGSLNRREALRAEDELRDIRANAWRFRRRDGGVMTPRDRDQIQQRLDDLSRRLHWMNHNDH